MINRGWGHLRWGIAFTTMAFVAMPAAGGAHDGRPAAGNFSGLVEVAPGRELYVECRGKGSPTVVLIAGKGTGAADWHQVLDATDPIRDVPTDEILAGGGDLHDSKRAVYPTISRETRVCSYDRPNTRSDGKDTSTPSDQPHAVDQAVDDLHRVLQRIDPPEPYVLVAHSYGGFIAELYARTHSAEVGGLVMVDAGSSYIGRAATAEKLGVWDQMNRLASPGQEGVEIADALAKIDAAPPMRPLPSIVLSADKGLRDDVKPVDADASVTFDDWLVGQDLLVKGLGAKQVSETDSGHHVYLYSPQLVIRAIREVVADVRDGNAG